MEFVIQVFQPKSSGGTMGETKNTKHLGRSIGAVLAGVVVGVILSLGTDAALRAAGIFPASGGTMSDGLFALATAYRTVYGVLSCYITARLAPSRPMFHALALGTIGFVLSIVGAAVTWNMVPSLGSHWYPIALVVLVMPEAWLGGALREIQLRGRTGG
jgi:Na+/citrate or Na+/malate symporter